MLLKKLLVFVRTTLTFFPFKFIPVLILLSVPSVLHAILLLNKPYILFNLIKFIETVDERTYVRTLITRTYAVRSVEVN